MYVIMVKTPEMEHELFFNILKNKAVKSIALASQLHGENAKERSEAMVNQLKEMYPENKYYSRHELGTGLPFKIDPVTWGVSDAFMIQFALERDIDWNPIIEDYTPFDLFEAELQNLYTRIDEKGTIRYYHHSGNVFTIAKISPKDFTTYFIEDGEFIQVHATQTIFRLKHAIETIKKQAKFKEVIEYD